MKWGLGYGLLRHATYTFVIIKLRLTRVRMSGISARMYTFWNRGFTTQAFAIDVHHPFSRMYTHACILVCHIYTVYTPVYTDVQDHFAFIKFRKRYFVPVFS